MTVQVWAYIFVRFTKLKVSISLLGDVLKNKLVKLFWICSIKFVQLYSVLENYEFRHRRHAVGHCKLIVLVNVDLLVASNCSHHCTQISTCQWFGQIPYSHTFMKTAWSLNSSANFSTAGEICWHGPHHGAMKSATTIFPLFVGFWSTCENSEPSLIFWIKGCVLFAESTKKTSLLVKICYYCCTHRSLTPSSWGWPPIFSPLLFLPQPHMLPIS